MGMGLKLTLAAAAVAAAGGSYYFYNQAGGDLSQLNIPGVVAQGPKAIDFVPADTLFFMGGLKPFNVQDSLKLYAQSANELGHLQALLTEMLDAVDGTDPQQKNLKLAGQRFAVAFLSEYLKELATPDTLATRIGLETNADAAIYSVGPLPVMRFKLGNEQAFKDFIGRVEQRAGVSAVQAKLGELAYASYSLTETTDPKPVSLVVSQHQGFAVLTLDLGDLLPKEQSLAIALGATKPASPLEASGRLQKLVKDYALDPRSLGFLNHQAIASSLTNPQSLLNGLIDKVATEPSEQRKVWQSAECQKDLGDLTAAWPQTVVGYTLLDYSSSPIKTDALVMLESTDQNSLQELRKLRGFIPSLVSTDKSWFSLGLGLNLDNLAPVLGNLWGKATQAQLSCAPLKEAQQGLASANPMMLGMMTGMAQGVEGVSFSLTDLKLTPGASLNDAPNLQSVSALLTLSAKDPKRLWDTVAAMQPMLASFTFPEQGKAVDLALPLPPQVPVKLKLGLYGTNLVLFTADAATQQQAEALAKEPAAANGLYKVAIRYKPLLDLAKPFIDLAEKEQDVDAQTLQSFKSLLGRDMELTGGLDIETQGIKLFGNSRMTLTADKK